VAVIDAKTFEVLDYLLVGRRVWQLAFTPDEASCWPPTASAATFRSSM
jgi:hypothetical protein